MIEILFTAFVINLILTWIDFKGSVASKNSILFSSNVFLVCQGTSQSSQFHPLSLAFLKMCA